MYSNSLKLEEEIQKLRSELKDKDQEVRFVPALNITLYIVSLDF